MRQRHHHAVLAPRPTVRWRGELRYGGVPWAPQLRYVHACEVSVVPPAQTGNATGENTVNPANPANNEGNGNNSGTQTNNSNNSNSNNAQPNNQQQDSGKNAINDAAGKLKEMFDKKDNKK